MTFRIYRLCPTCSVAMIVFVLLCSMAAAPAWALPITDQFILSGLVNNPGTFDLADLKAFPQATQHVTYQSVSGTTSGSFTGVPLYDFLRDPRGGNGLVLSGGVKNDFLRDYVVATGSGGYRAIVSVGEIHPNFGRQQDLLAHQFNGQPLVNDRFVRLTSPGDNAGGRYVSNLASLQVLSATQRHR
jgi:DMSO/TMAO reductase YedYZ molybdopterin-dependent catalytic subunit